MNIILRWIINAFVLILIAYYLPGVEVSGFYSALIVALVLGIINAVIKPIIVFLTLPLNIITLGLFVFVINALMFWFAGTIVKRFDVSGFWPAFYGSLALTFVSWSVNLLFGRERA